MKGEDVKKDVLEGNYLLLSFSTKHLSQTDKVKFHYALKGRNGSQGLLEKANGKHMAPSVLLISNNSEQLLLNFFKEWDVPFEKHSIVIKKKEEKK